MPVVTRQQEIVNKTITPPSPPPVLLKRVKLVARTKRKRDVPETHVEGSQLKPDKPEDSSDDWSIRNKIPRMRMHADDEEEKLQRKQKRELTSNKRYYDYFFRP